MDSPRTFTGKTVDEALEGALEALGVDLEDVDYRVVSPGRSGILGFGGEPARIEVTRVSGSASVSRDDEPDDGAPAASSEAEPTSDEEQDERPRRERRGRGRGGRGRGRGRGIEDRERTRAEEPASKSEEEDQSPAATNEPGDYDELEEAEYEDEQSRESETPPAERDSEAEQLVAEVLDYFLATMGVIAETYVRDDTEDGSLVFEIEGEDAGLLIGRRGETLHALQFLVRMVVSRQLGRKAFVTIDVEDYRQRRADMLRRLARRTAGRVASSGRSAALDPMPPGERRIVHMSLASHKRVRTESEGEGNQRRVVILPRR